ncbi:MAG: RNA-binding S4 domain-containing protein [Flavobacteriales bacterium]|nr:RNA-binding S4 domain-containing protein [Flavobacteriales bacterium]
MRIDKFLWHVRMYKTRSIATEAVKNNRVLIGEQTVKSSKEVNVGDEIVIKKNQINYKIRIKDLPKSRLGAKLVPQYIDDLTDVKEIEKFKQINQTQKYYRQKGLGRPTKKDRREIDTFLDDDFIFDSESE